MSTKSAQQEAPTTFFATPWVGTVLTVASGLSFLVVCMVLPLVGKAGAVVPYSTKNFVAFLAVLLTSLVLAVLASISKFERRKIDNSPLPLFSLILLALCVLLLVALLTGMLHI